MALLQSKWRRSKCLSCSSFFVVASAPLIMLSLAPTFRYALPLLWNCSPSFVDDVHTVSFCRRCYMRCMHFFCQNSVPSTSSYPHASSKCKYVMQILYAYIICAGVCIRFTARLLQSSHPIPSPASCALLLLCSQLHFYSEKIGCKSTVCKTIFITFAVLFLSLQTSISPDYFASGVAFHSSVCFVLSVTLFFTPPTTYVSGKTALKNVNWLWYAVNSIWSREMTPD